MKSAVPDDHGYGFLYHTPKGGMRPLKDACAIALLSPQCFHSTKPAYTYKKSRAQGTAFFENLKRLTFEELESCASTAETVFFTFFGTGVTGQEASMFEGRTELGIIVDERTGDTLKDSTSLTGLAAAANIDDDIKVFSHVHEIKRLTKDHAERGTIEVFFNALLVDGDIAFAGTKINTRYGAFTTTCS